MQFDGPPEQFLLHLLAVQCHVSRAEGGAIIRITPRGPEVLSLYPQPKGEEKAPPWVAHAVEAVPRVQQADRVVESPYHSPDDLYGQRPVRHVVMLPIRGGQGVRGVAAFLVHTPEPHELAHRRERLELTVGLLGLYEMRLTLQRRGADLQRLRKACQVQASLNESRRFKGAAMALCNEVASHWDAERVSLGFLKGKYVKMAAMSHTEKFNRKENLVQDIESAMEECLDQDVEVLHPSSPEATYICRTTAELSQRHSSGTTTIVSFPMRRDDKPAAVLTIERAADKPFTLDEVETLRLLCDLVTARLDDLHDTDKWIGARVASSTRKGLATLVGPTHTWIKVAVIAVAAILGFMIFVDGTYRVEAPFKFEATTLQVVPAPFEGYLKAVHVKPGDQVAKGDPLAELDTADLRLQQAAAESELAGYLKQADIHRREGKTGEMQVQLLEAERMQARINLIKYQIERARITAPIDGIVVTGDLEKQLGAPLSTGDKMFEVAPLTSLRAILAVPEDQIADVDLTLTGELASAAHPGDYLKFDIERINPVAEVDGQSNVFRVRARLTDPDVIETHAWLRPGMEGLAKIDVGPRSYAYIWSRDLINWVRMKLWW